MTFTITIHSLRGGTGKTLVSINLASFLAKLGYRVFIIDMDIGAPSLNTYVQVNPNKYINDYFNDDAELDDIFVDATELIGKDIRGALVIALANDKLNFVSKLEDIDREKSLEELYRLNNLVKEILSKDPWNADFVILDTSPGFAKDSLNAVAAADHLILMLRLINADLFGSGELLRTLHMSLKPPTSLVVNQVPSTFIEDDSEEYTKKLIRKHIIDPIGSDIINIAGFITNDPEIIENEALFAMYYLEEVDAQRPIHVINNPNGMLAKNIKKIADYVIKLAEG